MFLVSFVCLLCHFLEYHNTQESIIWMFLRHSGCVACWLLVVGPMSVVIGCLWCCICAMDWIVDRESVKMTMIFTHGGLGFSHSLDMVCTAECIAFSSASYLLK